MVDEPIPAEFSEISAPPTVDWADFRRHMPVTRRWAYLDHAAVAPLSAGAMAALAHWADDAGLNGSANYPAWSKQIRDLRVLSAQMIAADPEEMAFVGNTTAGINFVAEGFPWQPGDNVVTRADEFPANQYPWLHLADRGIETRRISVENGRLQLDRLAEAIDHRTRIVTLSWVAFSNGWRHELDEIVKLVHDRGAAFSRCDPRPGRFSAGCEKNARRFPRRRWPQVAARPRGGGLVLRPPRAFETITASRRRLE